MCDYSITAKSKMDATVGQKIVTSKFGGVSSTGFAPQSGDGRTAVCLRPGTELAFAQDVVVGKDNYGSVARFRQTNLSNSTTHHDVLEFANGQQMYVAALPLGIEAEVLQLPTGKDVQNRIDFQENRAASGPVEAVVLQQPRRRILEAVGGFFSRGG